MTRIAPKIAFAAALAVFGTAAQAADFVFGTKVAGDGAGTVNFASLTITQNGANVDFFLNAYGLEAFGPGAFPGAPQLDSQGRASYGRATKAYAPRQVQLAARVSF